MPEKSLTGACAVSLLFLAVASAFVWAEFGAFAVGLVRGMAGG